MRKLLAVSLTLVATAAAVPAVTSAKATDVPPLPDTNAVTKDDIRLVDRYATRFVDAQESHADAARIFLRDCSANPSSEWWQKVSRSRELVDDVVDGWDDLQDRIRTLRSLVDKTPIGDGAQDRLDDQLERVAKEAGTLKNAAVRLRGIYGDLKRFDCGVGNRLSDVRADTKAAGDRLDKALTAAEKLVKG